MKSSEIDIPQNYGLQVCANKSIQSFMLSRHALTQLSKRTSTSKLIKPGRRKRR